MLTTEEQTHRDKIELELQGLKLDLDAPADKKSKGYSKWLPIGLVCLILAAAWILVSPHYFKRGTAVEVSVVEQQGGEQAASVLSVVGYITATEKVQVTSPLVAHVAAVYVREGDLVQRGQLLARLDDAEIQAQIKQAQAHLQNLQARLNLLEHGPRQQEIEQSRTAVEEVEILSRDAETKLQNLKQLAAEGVVSTQEVRDAQSRNDIARAQLKAARQRSEIVRLGPRSEEIESARALVREAAASLQEKSAQLAHTQLRSPMMGLVVRRNLSPGEMVAVSSDALPLFVIIDPTSLKVDADVNQTDLPKIQLGAPAKFAVDGLPDKIYEGTVDEILPEADRQKNTVKVRLRLTNADQNLRMGMSVKVSLYNRESERESRRALFVPKDALIEEGGQAHVFVAEGARAVRRTITVGERFEDKVEVTDGLMPGEKLIVKGQNSLTDGSPISSK